MTLKDLWEMSLATAKGDLESLESAIEETKQCILGIAGVMPFSFRELMDRDLHIRKLHALQASRECLLDYIALIMLEVEKNATANT